MPSETPESLTRPDLRADWADDQLDRGLGCKLLAKRANAEIVQSSLLHDDGVKYALAAWCIMPTHVHALIELALRLRTRRHRADLEVGHVPRNQQE